MSFFNWFSLLSGLIGLGFTFYAFYEARRQQRILAWTFGTLAAFLLITALLSSIIPLPPGSAVTSSGNNRPSQQATSTTTPTSIVVPTSVSTPTPTFTPSPTQPLAPQTGTVLYRADWSSGMNGWAGGDDWKTSSGLLLNDGTQSNSISLAPYSPGNNNVANYAVETVIQFVRHSDEGAIGGLDSFGIIVRSPDGQKGYEFSACASAGFFSCGSNSVEILISNGSQNIAENPYQPQKGSTHTYRMEVKDNTIKVLIDGRLFLQATDNMYLSGGQVGLFSNRSQITIRSFIVTAL
jgi:hypothetical protein